MGLWSTLVERIAGSEINKRVDLKLKEALPAGLLDEDLTGWRRVTRSRFEEDAIVQEISLLQVQKLYTANPLAKWLLEMTRDLITAEGVHVESENTRVQEILDAFWDHDVNLMDINLPQMVLELGLWGEQCWPAFMPRGGGILSLGLVPSDMIKEVVHDPGNCALPIGVKLKDQSGQEGPKLRVIYSKPDDQLFTTKVRDLRAHEYNDGECFWFKINSVREATRGLSDLFTLSDWLDGYEELLFNLRDRDADLRAFAWDVTLKGYDDQQIADWLRRTDKPKPGSWFAHNENIELDAKTPQLNSLDTTSHARLYRNHILGSMAIPEHWMGGSGDVNRSCYSEDTETLTIDGWKHFSEIAVDTLIAQYQPESHTLEYVPAGPCYVKHYTGEMIHFENKTVDMLVTPDHRMWTKRGLTARADWGMTKAEDMEGWHRWHVLNSVPFADAKGVKVFTLPSKPYGLGRAVYPEVDIDGDIWAEFLGYWLSEGHANQHKGTYVINLAQKDPDTIVKIRRVLEHMPEIRWHEVALGKDGTTRWQVTDKALGSWLMEECGVLARNKHFPAMIKHFSHRQLQILFHALIDGDGSRDPRDGRTGMTYYTSSVRLADDVQLLAFNLGCRVKVNDYRVRTSVLRLQIVPNILESTVGKDAIKRVDYEGFVYCYSVPSGIFVTRRKGKIAIQGNTANEAHIPTFKRYMARQRYVRYMIEHVVKYQLVNAAEAGLISGGDVGNFKVVMPQMVTEDLTKIAASLQQLTGAAMQAVDLGWIGADTAQRLFATLAERLGVEIPVDAEAARAAAHVTPEYRGDDEKPEPEGGQA